MTNPRLSFVVPCYNVEEGLPQLLAKLAEVSNRL